MFGVWMFGKQLCITCRHIRVWGRGGGGGFPGLKLGTANSVYVPRVFLSSHIVEAENKAH